MGLNDLFNASTNTTQALGNISLLDPHYTGINWVRDNAYSVTGGDAAIWILLGLVVGLFLLFLGIPTVTRYGAAIFSTFATFILGMLFWYWEFLPQSQVFILFILFIMFLLSCVALYLRIRDERQSIQV